MTKVSAAAAAAAAAVVSGVLFTTAAGAQSFEGSITMRMSSRGQQGVTTQEMEYLMRGGKLRVTLAGPAGGMAMIAVPQDKKLYMLVAAQNSYVEMPLPDPASVAKGAAVQAEAVKVTRTGRMETVAGLSCEHVQLAAKSGATDVCLTKALGRFVNPLDGLRPGGTLPWQKQIENEFPLKVTLPDGSVPLEVTRVERKRLPNDLFAVPASYTKMTMPAGRPPG